MKRVEFDKAVKMAQEGTYDANQDDSVLHGCGLPGFVPVTITLDVAAKFLAWHCICLNGSVDCEQLTEMRAISRKKWIICN